MIDLHTHILPGIDDGSRSLEESLDMLREEARQGITEVVLTPHFYASENDIPGFLIGRYQAYKRLLPHLTDDLPQLRLGAEVQYFEGICAAEQLPFLQIQGTPLLLLEMPFCKWSERMLSDVLELNRREDTQVLLAHVERYFPFQPKATFSRLHDEGVLFQANVACFANWRTRRSVGAMLERGMISVLGSDCHSMGHRRPNWDTLPPKIWEKAQWSALLFSGSYLSEPAVTFRNLHQEDSGPQV